MQKFMQDTRRKIESLAALERKTRESEKRILASAMKRRAWVNDQIASLRGKVVGDDDAAERYQGMIHERGQLDTVIQNSRKALIG